MGPLISVIVPVYKVEPYLRRCLDSIVNQTYTNLEIILVDDGSPDSCPAICDEYAAKDNRIVVIHKENGGLSDARNAGLEICKGEYISFVDSDDWIADCFIEVLFKSIQDTNAEISICNYIRTSSSYSATIKINEIHKIVLSSTEAVKKLWSEEETTFVTAWGKIYKSNLWKDVRFPKGFIHEDEYTTHKLLFDAPKIIYLDISMYFYFQRAGSITAEANPSSIRVLKAQWERYKYFKKLNIKEITQLCQKKLCWDLLFAYGTLSQDQCKNIGFKNKKEILNAFHETVNDYAQRKKPTIAFLILLKIFYHCPKLYSLFRKISPFHLRNP